jgi:hypothetical protein
MGWLCEVWGVRYEFNQDDFPGLTQLDHSRRHMNRIYINSKDRRSIVGEFCPEFCNVQQKYFLEPVYKENISDECL